ncbi:hypothetical protein [Brevibacillus dissolubilis]|uniref:hypothetical protein n=1 Tax=Brevibacillus dissolubilis TaxID=1844116 RepID=UPI00159BA20A|nr:hypothetical protein [Brevibacillus dissolubilis]
MVFNFLFFKVKIERHHSTEAERMAQYEQECILNARDEKFAMEPEQVRIGM